MSSNKQIFKSLHKFIKYEEIHVSFEREEHKSSCTILLKLDIMVDDTIVIPKDTSYVSKKFYETMNTSKACAYTLALKDLGINMGVNEDSKSIETPLSVLNNFVSSKDISNKVEWKSREFYYTGSVSIENKSYSYDIEDKYTISYMKHKISMNLLKQLSTIYPFIYTKYRDLSKQTIFYKSQPSGLIESDAVELKGNSKIEVSMKQKEINKSELARQVCAYLNTKLQASIYVGIHDTGVVQGIEVDSVDKLKNDIFLTLKNLIFPPPTKYYSLHIHHVLYNDTNSGKKSKIPQRPENPCEYTIYLEKLLAKQKINFKSLFTHRSLIVLEIKLDKIVDIEFNVKGHIYRRTNGSTYEDTQQKKKGIRTTL